MHDLEIKFFRCFEQKQIRFCKQFTVITGDNGAGKTSAAEAIHYLCYMKSFRCSNVQDLLQHDQQSFFLKGSFTTKNEPQVNHILQVGYAHKKKVVKLDQKAIVSYKQIFDIFQVITLLEDDIQLIAGYPGQRRAFIDQAAALLNPTYLQTYRNFKRIVSQRNALLYSSFKDACAHEIWTEKLWTASLHVQQQRIAILKNIEQAINLLLVQYFDTIYQVQLFYEPEHMHLDESYETFKQRSGSIFEQEYATKRSLFGAHLDDFSVHMQGKPARFFASRGQQKLLSLLCKLSLVLLSEKQDFLPILILDDFIADFDQTRLTCLMKFLSSCKNQVIIITPLYDSELEKIIGNVDPEVLFMHAKNSRRQ